MIDMELLVQVWTPETFDEYALLPENRHRLLELIGGELVEVVASPKSSNVGADILTYINSFVLEHDLGHITGADGGYRVGQERYIPDVGFISYRAINTLCSQSYQCILYNTPGSIAL